VGIDINKRRIDLRRVLLSVLTVLCVVTYQPFLFAKTALPGFVIEDAFPTATLNLPVRIVFFPNGRKLVLEKEGLIWVTAADGTRVSTPFINITAKVSSNNGGGLPGIALDLDFTTNRLVYLLTPSIRFSRLQDHVIM
jgi:Glucose / Sorbosone dehydrogenase